MMDEMQKTLARRRAKVDRSSEEPDSDKQENGVVGDRRQGDGGEKSSSPGKPFSHPGSQAGSESPRPGERIVPGPSAKCSKEMMSLQHTLTCTSN